MKTVWTKGLDTQLEVDVKSAFKSSTVIRARLADLCSEKIDTSLSTNKAQYESPSWAYMQADGIGYRRAMEEVISLLEN